MNANDGSLPQGRAPDAAIARLGGDEIIHKTARVQIERKTFSFTLRENPRGRFLRITEDRRAQRDRIIIPAPGLPEFKRAIEEMIQALAELPAPVEPPGAVNE